MDLPTTAPMPQPLLRPKFRPSRPRLRRGHGAIWFAAILLSSFLTPPSSSWGKEGAKNAVYQSLVDPDPADPSPIRLGKARFHSGQSPQQQLDELNRAGRPKYDAEALLRPAVVAPHLFTLSREPLGQMDASTQHARVVFALRGAIETLAKDDFLNQLFVASEDEEGAGSVAKGASDPQGTNDSRPLLDAELNAAGIDPTRLGGEKGQPEDGKSDRKGGESYRLVRGELFSKVRISGVVHGEWTTDQDSILLAMRFDNRFADHPALKGTWERLERDDQGGLKVVQRGDWAGGGAYVRLTRCLTEPDRVICEAELGWVEPKPWFGGANLIGSKLPPVIQSQVREIRRAAIRQAN